MADGYGKIHHENCVLILCTYDYINHVHNLCTIATYGLDQFPTEISFPKSTFVCKDLLKLRAISLRHG